jgi:hypothetical protein
MALLSYMSHSDLRRLQDEDKDILPDHFLQMGFQARGRGRKAARGNVGVHHPLARANPHITSKWQPNLTCKSPQWRLLPPSRRREHGPMRNTHSNEHEWSFRLTLQTADTALRRCQTGTLVEYANRTEQAFCVRAVGVLVPGELLGRAARQRDSETAGSEAARQRGTTVAGGSVAS